MPRIARARCPLFLVIMIGCGGGSPSTSNPGTPPPHGGTLVKRAGGKDYVEVVQKAAASASSPLTGELTFYFFKEDGTTPVSPSPSTGTLEVGKKTITLKPDGDGLATPNGPPLFPQGGLDGVLSVDLDGKPVKIPLGVR
jgi:hypothetical protein